MSFTIRNTFTIQKALSKSRDVIQTISDPFFKYVSALIKGTNVNNGTNNTFLDSSPNNFTLTRNGTPTQGTFSPYLENYSVQFNGSTDKISVPFSSNLQFGTGDFTIEGWIFPTASGQSNGSLIVGQQQGGISTGWAVELVGTTLKFHFISSTDRFVTSSVAVSLNSWTHFAVCRTAGFSKIYVNGTLAGTLADTYSYNTYSYPFTIGSTDNSYSNTWFSGYISNLRVVKGTAIYTSEFTPPTSKLSVVSNTSLLTLQSNRFIDLSTNNFSLTITGTPKIQSFSPFSPTVPYTPSVHGGSGYFNGSTDVLTVPSSTNLTLGAGDFTLEAWVYNQGGPYTYTGRIMETYHTSNINGWCFGINRSNSGPMGVYFAYNNIFISTTTNNGYIPKNAWSHVAVARQSGTIRIFLNGKLLQSISNSYNDNNPYIASIGAEHALASGTPIQGYISDLRIVKGTAVYTADFIVPTSPLPAVPNTQFLGNFTNGNILDHSKNSDLTTFGDLKTSTSTTKFNSTSLYFDGNGDYMTAPNISNYEFGTGDFTVDAWVNFNSFPSTNSRVVGLGSGANTGVFSGWALNVTGTGTSLTFYRYDGTETYVQANYTFSTGIWYHIAVSRSGSTIKLFVNGTQIYTGTNSISYNSVNSDPIYIGTQYDGANSSNSWKYINGYIDSLRITKGVARYTASFTPPTTSFPTQ